MSNKQPIPRGPVLLMAGLSFLVVAVGGFAYGQFDYVNVCPACGRAQFATAYQVPLTRWTYYTDTRIEATSLSRTLESHGLVTAHPHDWQLVTGSGNGVTLLIGDGKVIATSLISPSMGPFLESVLKWTDRETALHWLDRMRDPGDASFCRSLAELCRQETFNSRSEWERWVADTEARIHPYQQ